MVDADGNLLRKIVELDLASQRCEAEAVAHPKAARGLLLAAASYTRQANALIDHMVTRNARLKATMGKRRAPVGR